MNTKKEETIIKWRPVSFLSSSINPAWVNRVKERGAEGAVIESGVIVAGGEKMIYDDSDIELGIGTRVVVKHIKSSIYFVTLEDYNTHKNIVVKRRALIK